MATLAEYGDILSNQGFTSIVLADIGAEYRAEAHREHDAMRGPLKQRMADLLGAAKQAHFVENWRAMTVVLDRGELRPARFRAVKPA